MKLLHDRGEGARLQALTAAPDLEPGEDVRKVPRILHVSAVLVRLRMRDECSNIARPRVFIAGCDIRDTGRAAVVPRLDVPRSATNRDVALARRGATDWIMRA